MEKIKSVLIKLFFLCCFLSGFDGWGQELPSVDLDDLGEEEDITAIDGVPIPNGELEIDINNLDSYLPDLGEEEDSTTIDGEPSPTPTDGNPDVCINNLGSANCSRCPKCPASCPAHMPPTGEETGMGKMTEVKNYSKIFSLFLSPNPISHKHFTIDIFSLEIQKYSFQLYNINGQQVHHFGTQSIQKGFQRLDFDLPNTITAGIYWVVIEGDDVREVVKVVVQ